MQQLRGLIRNAVASYQRALAIHPDNFDANQSLASAYLQLGRPADATPYAKRATEIMPESQAAWANLATSQSLAGLYNDAVESYRQALELGEPAEPILLGLADAHIRLNHFERAINVLQTLIRTTPSTTAYERTGYSQFKLRNFEDALKNYRIAYTLDSQDTAVLNGLGVCLMTMYIQSGRAQTAQRDEAVDSWQHSLQLRPNQPKIVDLLTRYQRL
jgi:superkiller protein 3